MNSEPVSASHWSAWLAWFLLLLIAAAFRCYELGDVSAWYDEAATWKTISLPWSEMWDSLRKNVHPPVYYLAVRGWSRCFGDSIDGLRLFSVLCGMLTLPVVEKVARELSDNSSQGSRHRIPHLATWVYALSPIAIEQSQQTRMYALAILLAAGLGWGLVRVLHRPASWSGWVALSLCGNLLPLTHYYGLWNSAVAALAVLTFTVFSPRLRLFDCRWQWGTAMGITVAAWIGWLPVFLDQHSRVQAAYWIPDFSTSELTVFIAEWSSSPHIRDLAPPVIRWTCGVTVILAGALFFSRSPGRLVLAAMALGPPVISTVYSLWTRNLLQGRYWCMAHLYFVIGIALLASTIRSVKLRRVAIILLLAGSIGWSIQGLRDRSTLAMNAGLRECGQVLQQRRQVDEPVFVASPYYGPSIQRYQLRLEGVYILKPYQPLNHFQGQAIIRPGEIQPLDAAVLADADRFWVVADELLSLTVQNPHYIPIPSGWKLVSTTAFPEANRLPTRLELREYVRER